MQRLPKGIAPKAKEARPPFVGLLGHCTVCLATFRLEKSSKPEWLPTGVYGMLCPDGCVDAAGQPAWVIFPHDAQSQAALAGGLK